MMGGGECGLRACRRVLLCKECVDGWYVVGGRRKRSVKMRKVVVSGRLLIRIKRKKVVELANEDEGPVTSKRRQMRCTWTAR
jgi:hypothetical protein